MLNQKDINQLADKLAKKFHKIKAIIQFGSSVSGDYNEKISDVDLAIITKSEKSKEQIDKFISKEYSHFDLQAHIFPLSDFIKNLKQGVPLNLSIVYAGNPLYGNEYCYKLRNRGFKPTKNTIRKCMLNSFAALGLGISDLTHGMLYDSVNSIYHAARSSIWAALLPANITPNNKRIFKLVKDKKISKLYKKILYFREEIPDYEIDAEFDKKIYKKGNVNEFTQLLDDASNIIKINYKKIFGKDFIDLFELLKILNKKYDKVPDFYFVMLNVNWKKETIFYDVMLSFGNDKRLMIEVNANNGVIKEIC